MSNITSLGIALGCLIMAGCSEKQPTNSTATTTNARMSLTLLDGVQARRIPIQVGGEKIEATIFGKDLGESALFLCYYSLPVPAEDASAREAAINAEINRCISNSGAELVSREVSLEGEKATAEIVAKSPRKPSHSIRFRVICSGKEIHSLTAITPDSQDDSHIQALNAMFDEFDAN